MLKEQDRQSYKKALRDLKDYGVYKEVMEAAMVRLQKELDALVLENKVTELCLRLGSVSVNC